MNTTQPIRDTRHLQTFKMYYKDTKPCPRNYLLIIMGLNTALRITDILNLRWKDIYNFKKKCIKDHLVIKEQKTGKTNQIAINDQLREAILSYKTEDVIENDYIFVGNNDSSKPICRQQAYRIIKEAALYAGESEHISCHSLRKTFGYYAWKQGVPPVILMNIFNHSSFQITKRYLGIEQDDKDMVFMNINI